METELKIQQAKQESFTNLQNNQIPRENKVLHKKEMRPVRVEMEMSNVSMYDNTNTMTRKGGEKVVFKQMSRV